MQKLSNTEYLKLNKLKRIWYKLLVFIFAIPSWFVDKFKKIGRFFKKLGLGIVNEFIDIGQTFKNGDWKTRTSFFIMGFGSIARKQIGRGILFLLTEVVFIVYMIVAGGYWLSMLPSLGKQGPQEIFNEELGITITVYGDNSFKILLYGVLTIFFIIGFIYTWRVNVKQNKIAQEILSNGKLLKGTKDDLRSLVDENFHKTLLALPTLGMTIFTILPIIFMILVAFTNYDGTHDGYNNNLFHWVGLDNFNTLLNFTNGSNTYSIAFGEVLAWTLIWAFFATFTNYFLGMIVAMIINKKGIKLKKLWRTILVITIAVPQFISLLYIKQIFEKNGIFNQLLLWMHFIEQPIDFWGNPNMARILVILINIWVGIPYLMLIATGILMNIPQDLYESAKIDGANIWQQYFKITLPYMLFITGPYLLTSFTSNINNFNIIYLLTAGGPTDPDLSGAAGSVGNTDLLITWLFKITTGADSKYYMASVIAIMVFVVIAVISLIIYGLMPSVKNEEDFQ